MKIIFFGTGKFGIPTLKGLLNSKHEVIAVVTQPDRAKGRGYNVLPTPVKAYIEKAAPGVDILQPEDSQTIEFLNVLKVFDADLFVVVDYGQKLSNEILDLPSKYSINLHPSLLPEYRGASPINNAILDGKITTGNTIFKMAEKMDAGDIIIAQEVKILPEENALDLAGRLSLFGADLVLKAVDILASDKETLSLQNEDKATYAHKIGKEDGKINWQNSAVQILNQIRAFQPWPGAYTHIGGKLLKIIKAQILNENKDKAKPGMVLSDKELIVATGDGCLKILVLQLEGKKAMPSEDFLRGKTFLLNTILS